jgi:hypothetical protein
MTPNAFPITDKEAATLQAWLLALLRFAVTCAPADRMVALAAAAELDRPAAGRATTAPHFFRRTSADLCAAIADRDHINADATLQAHLARIANPRLQRAFAAALDLKCPKPTAKRRSGGRKIRAKLWKGLAMRPVTANPPRATSRDGRSSSIDD